MSLTNKYQYLINQNSLLVAAFSLFYIVGILLALCLFGNILTSNLALVADLAYDSQWYTYPTRTQLYLAFMIRSAQTPFWISAFGIMPCTLENFAAVINSAISFFMVMRNFS